MSTFTRVLFAIGVALVIAGSFLPWQVQGDFIPYRTYGIRILPTFQDNGGVLVVLLSIVMTVIVFRPLKIVGQPEVWADLVAVTLVLDSAFQIAGILVARLSSSGAVGAPMAQVGLILVCIGSMLLLATSLLYHLRQSQ